MTESNYYAETTRASGALRCRAGSGIVVELVIQLFTWIHKFHRSPSLVTMTSSGACAATHSPQTSMALTSLLLWDSVDVLFLVLLKSCPSMSCRAPQSSYPMLHSFMHLFHSSHSISFLCFILSVRTPNGQVELSSISPASHPLTPLHTLSHPLTPSHTLSQTEPNR